jgi:hypothetical protein
VRLLHNFILHFLLWLNRGKEPQFRKWIFLETQKEKILQAVENGDDFPSELLSYISTAWGVSYKWFEFADWTLIAKAFYLCLFQSPNIELPLITPTNEKSKDEPWDYKSRTWHLYSHLLAKAYGWTLEYISCLRVEDALSKIQEIIVEDQLEKEFFYGLSEVAYHYDKSTKTSKFVPMPRPHWMRAQPKPIQRFKIPVSMMPMGVVIMDNVLPEEYMPKEIH